MEEEWSEENSKERKEKLSEDKNGVAVGAGKKDAVPRIYLAI